ncbi:hypothetical protein BRADI_1g48842v3 [Brachypodium distachyon]|uniref:VQ domain-containing protein n=1 Tax=Brachypodium distachyon TaxID=15368 RepID=A0A0Q3HAC3_BRADI|nr:hypothetical protein BRADI_1g48842v3 [Brachypodium distachyon]
MESRGRGSGGGAAGRRTPPPPSEVKVTHIITTEVSADEASFKDVVQRLTGKDSAPARAAVLLANSAAPAAGPSRVNNGSSSVAGDGGSAGGVEGPSAGAAPPSAFEGTLPSLEEMNRWWGTHG